MGGVNRFGEDGVERGFEAGAGRFAIHRRVFVAVGDPEVGDAGLAELFSDVGGDLAAGDAVFDPVLAHPGVRVGEGEAVVGQRVGEVGGVEVQAQRALLAPVDPALELGGGVGVALHFLAAKIGVAGVEVEPVFAGDEREGLVEVCPEFVQRAGFAGVVAGGLDAAAGQALCGMFGAAHIVALPAVQGYGDGRQFLEGGFGIHAERGVGCLGEGIGLGTHGMDGEILLMRGPETFEVGADADDEGGENEREDARGDEPMRLLAGALPFVEDPAPHRAEDDDAGHVEGPTREAELAHLGLAHGVEKELKIPGGACKR